MKTATRTFQIALVISIFSLLIACQPKTEDASVSITPNKKSSLVKVEHPVKVKVEYPVTAKGDVVDVYFGEQVADPYRWLEDDRSNETEAWIISQNETTQTYLQKIPFRKAIAQRIRSMFDYERVSAPFTEGDYVYFYKNDGLQNHSVVYRQKIGGEGEAEVFIDPNSFSEDGTVSLSGLSFSTDGSMAAYQTSDGGCDWCRVYIMDTATKELLDDTLENVKFSGLSWYKNEGIYYSSYDKPKGSELSEKTVQHKLFYHEIGTKQADDKKVYGHIEEEKHRYVGAQVSEDNRFLLVSAATSTSGNRAFLKDLSKPDAPWKTVISSEQSDVYMLTTKGDLIYLVSNYEAPNGKIVVVDASAPNVDNWKDLIPEAKSVLSASTAGGYIFAEYMVNTISEVYQYTLEGFQLRTIKLPSIGSAGMNSAKFDAKTSYYSFSNYITPTSIYALDVDTGKSSLFSAPETKFDTNQFVSKQVFFSSKDGTRVPMIVSYHKDTILNGQTPTILYGYGGFNVSLTPDFSPTAAAWLELGGIYAVPNIRGGGEYGKNWHKAGIKQQKQNVFDDFIAAAEYLINNRYTSRDLLALRGGSNGGLLVGAVMTQRPDLAKVALPAVGVLDMLRYHTFTAGAGWAYDYGTSEQSEEMYRYLKGYSPVHNVKAGIEYPATMISTADHDDRVVPAHSFKFAAVLQESQRGKESQPSSNPTLIRIEKDAGHGAGTSISKTIELYADMYSFALFNMGAEPL